LERLCLKKTLFHRNQKAEVEGIGRKSNQKIFVKCPFPNGEGLLKLHHHHTKLRQGLVLPKDIPKTQEKCDSHPKGLSKAPQKEIAFVASLAIL
jgi:hypothetical protein